MAATLTATSMLTKPESVNEARTERKVKVMWTTAIEKKLTYIWKDTSDEVNGKLPCDQPTYPTQAALLAH